MGFRSNCPLPAFAVYSGLPADLRHFTEPFLDEVKRLNKKLWGPSNIENAGRFETICDLALSASPLDKAIESVLDTNYPAVADRTNAEVDNFVMFIIQTLTNQTNAGDTARTALTNQVYGSQVHEESNKLWTPVEFFDRVNEVLDLISKLEHALTDWSEDDKFTVIYNMFPRVMRDYVRYSLNDGEDPLSDDTVNCARLIQLMDNYYQLKLNKRGARINGNDDESNNRGRRRQRNDSDGRWTPRGNNGNDDDRGDRGGYNGHDGGNNRYPRSSGGRRQGRSRGSNNGGNNDSNYNRGNNNGDRGGHQRGSYQGRGNRNQGGGGRGRSQDQGRQGQRRFYQPRDHCPLHSNGNHQWGTCRCNPRNNNFQFNDANRFAESAGSEFNWYRNLLRSQGHLRNSNNNQDQGGSNQGGNNQGNNNQGGNNYQGGNNQGNQGGASYAILPAIPSGVPPFFGQQQQKQQQPQGQSSYWMGNNQQQAPNNNAPPGGVVMSNGGIYFPPPPRS